MGCRSALGIGWGGWAAFGWEVLVFSRGVGERVGKQIMLTGACHRVALSQAKRQSSAFALQIMSSPNHSKPPGLIA
jgi:hypothetical protein